jgi:hypothetical protein
MTDLITPCFEGYCGAMRDRAQRIATANPYRENSPEWVAWDIGAWLFTSGLTRPERVQISPSSWALGRYHLIYVDGAIVRWLAPGQMEIVS